MISTETQIWLFGVAYSTAVTVFYMAFIHANCARYRLWTYGDKDRYTVPSPRQSPKPMEYFHPDEILPTFNGKPYTKWDVEPIIKSGSENLPIIIDFIDVDKIDLYCKFLENFRDLFF